MNWWVVGCVVGWVAAGVYGLALVVMGVVVVRDWWWWRNASEEERSRYAELEW